MELIHTEADGPFPLAGSSLPEIVEGFQRQLNAFEEAPADTDLDQDIKVDTNAEPAEDSSAWARTSLAAFSALLEDLELDLVAAARYNLTARKPCHVVVFCSNG